MSAWGQWGSAKAHARYREPIDRGDPGWRRLCNCGCRKRQSHRGMANGVCLMSGCELRVRRWVRDGFAR